MTQTIGFVGFGHVNSSLAQHAVSAGYNVLLSNSRGPATLADAVTKLGTQAKAATVEEVVRQSDLVSVSVPLKSIKLLPAELFVGKTVIDSNNYYPERDGEFPELEKRVLTTSELVQRHLQGARVVKVFNSIDQFHIKYGARPADDPTRWALPLAGDNLEAKAEVAKFVDAVGFDAVDCGSLADSWRFQPNTPAYCVPYIGEVPEGTTSEEMLKWVQDDHSKVVRAADVQALVAQAKTSDPVGGIINTPKFVPAYIAMFALPLP
ncbi:hypothetical protein PHYBOEH_001830 [Phytophthora boehmeriae]|uniref:Pyrroline-5-carboxylate reductase catalytic N-terminal domain-containing protein n=1 Tax=Phytophthora boehmeriae TaxID=109152 RepID=A0A8T1WVJ3_9STRA|nr:hypothetical protein PHYBOEH_001830 [Phytophthora boehmeriae]